MRRRAVAVAAGVLVIAGVVLGVIFGVVQNQGPAGPPPLGNPAAFVAGVECTPGTTLANGFYALENHSGQTVRITSVRLTGGAGQEMTSPAYLTPAGPATNLPLIGLVSWPPAAPQWKQHRLAVGAVIAPHAWANLVFAQTRTSDDPKPAAPEITYTAGGVSYSLTERTKSLVAVSCPA